MRAALALTPFTLLMAVQAASPSAAQVEQRLKRDLQYLAASERKGRGNGYAELDQAAEYLRKQYRKLGLKVEVQRFPFIHRIERLKSQATLGAAGKPLHSLSWGRELEAYGYSADADLKDKALVFAGFGLKVGDYDDFAGLELKDKAVVISRTVPELPAFKALGRNAKGLLARIQGLQEQGVAAVLVLEEGEGARKLQREEGPLSFKVPVLSLGAKCLEPLGEDLKARLERIRTTGSAASLAFAPVFRLNLALRLKRHKAQLPNLAVTLPGRDPKLKGEFLALGAHLDHLGLGERHSLLGEAGLGQVHAGADDNASGTAMVVELARRLKSKPPKRSVVLLHFSGEEEGLLGSAHWIQHPTVPLPSVKFMLNFDMVGRLDEAKPTLLMGGLGAPKSALDQAKRFAPTGVSVGGDSGMAVGGSDHMSFSAAKIPTFFFFTGVHTDYHRPSDVPEKLNLKGMRLLADMADQVIRDLANAEAVPAFDPETAKLPTVRDMGPVRVAFGSIPDFTEHPKGFRINGTSPGSSAEALGLKAGDVLLSFGGKPVKNIYDFQAALSAFKPGDRVKVQWLRGEEAMEGEAILKGR